MAGYPALPMMQQSQYAGMPYPGGISPMLQGYTGSGYLPQQMNMQCNLNPYAEPWPYRQTSPYFMQSNEAGLQAPPQQAVYREATGLRDSGAQVGDTNQRNYVNTQH